MTDDDTTTDVSVSSIISSILLLIAIIIHIVCTIILYYKYRKKIKQTSKCIIIITVLFSPIILCILIIYNLILLKIGSTRVQTNHIIIATPIQQTNYINRIEYINYIPQYINPPNVKQITLPSRVISVKSYYRKDGTYVRSHTRRI